ncbi:MAG TPA: YetF domain-containing protein [Chthoniobacterales bacterium]|nr:YetF domain-containing protein [Chthoniobacterales bacterium]
MFFNGWYPLQKTVICGIIGYAALLILLRISGKRTLSKWNAFDFAITVAFGSTLAMTLLSKNVSIIQGVIALALLVGLQFAVTWISVRWPSFSYVVKAEPSLLLFRGEFQHDTMRQQRVTEDEVRGALRSHGLTSPENALAVVLEPDGSFSVLSEPSDRGDSTLSDVHGYSACADADSKRKHQ